MSPDRPIAVVLGTRPEIIKLAEIVQILGERALLVHTGQHWDHAMSGQFMTGLGLPNPAISLAVGGTTRATQIAQTLEGLDVFFASNRPAAVVVQGDTNTVIGGALAASTNDIPLVHVEAGLRSFDRDMPEESNRIVTDHLADLCLAPTEHSRQLLLAEGIPDERVVVTGNTVVGAVTRVLDAGSSVVDRLLRSYDLDRDDYIVATIHRPENTDVPEQLTTVMRSLAEIAESIPLVLPLHPRTRLRLEQFGLTSLLAGLRVIDPLAYDEFVPLCASAALTISDSGGVQEEASVWKRPVIVVRRSTERPEVQGTFAHLTASGSTMVEWARKFYADRHAIHSSLADMPSPYGEIDSASRCVSAIRDLLGTPAP